MSLATERLRSLRHLYDKRGEALGGKDIAFYIYAGLLVLAVVAFPLVRLVALFLARPSSLAALQLPDVGTVVGVACGVLLATTVATGRVRGPVTPSPFFVMLLAATDLPRRVALRRSFLTNAFVVTASTAVIGALFVVACACFRLIGSVTWLVGQSIASRWLWFLGVALIAGAGLVWAYPPAGAAFPWGWIGQLRCGVWRRCTRSGIVPCTANAGAFLAGCHRPQRCCEVPAQ